MDLYRKSCDAIDNAAKDLHEISHKIWSNPEENFEEFKAHQNITEFLAEREFVVDRNYVVETGFRSVVGSDTGPHIAVLCEYDALPGIGHACGHNLISEVGLAAGIGIRAAMKASGKSLGKLTILGTPAEEGCGGKINMIDAGVFKDVDVALMAHPAPFNLDAFHSLAIEQVNVKYHGKAAHASAFPWNGVNALDAAVLCYQNVSCMRQQMKPAWRTHGIIKNGGAKPNIIPDLTELEFYARTPTRKELDELKNKLDQCFNSAAAATGCTVDVKWEGKPYYDMRNNKTTSDLFLKHAKSLGVDFDVHGTAHFGGNVPRGSTDMGNVSYHVPSIHPMFYIGSEAMNHTKEFTEASGDEKAQPYTLAVAKAVATTAIDLMFNPDLLNKAKEEFKRLEL